MYRTHVWCLTASMTIKRQKARNAKDEIVPTKAKNAKTEEKVRRRFKPKCDEERVLLSDQEKRGAEPGNLL